MIDISGGVRLFTACKLVKMRNPQIEKLLQRIFSVNYLRICRRGDEKYF